jgi:multidrug resistance efflux pump
MTQPLADGHVSVPSTGATPSADFSSATPLVQSIPSVDADVAALEGDAAKLATDVTAYETTTPSAPTPASELADVGAALSAASAQHDADVAQAATDAATIAALQAQLAAQTPPATVPPVVPTSGP